MSLLLQLLRGNWCPDTPDTKQYRVPLIRDSAYNVPFQYYTQEYVYARATETLLYAGGLSAFVLSAWSQIAQLSTQTWPRSQSYFYVLGNFLTYTWGFGLYVEATVSSPGFIQLDYHLILNDETLFAASNIFDNIIFTTIVPQSVASDWQWTALQISITASEFDVNLWFKNGIDGTMVGPVSNVYTFATIRALLIAFHGYTPAQAANWIPIDVASLAFGVVGISSPPQVSDGYFYHGNVQATSSVLSNSTLEAIADSTPPYPGSWADWTLSWINGSLDLSDLSGNGHNLLFSVNYPPLGGPPFILTKTMRPWGFEAIVPSPHKIPWLQATNPDVPAADLRAGTGWESILSKPYRSPWLQSTNPDVFPAVLNPTRGWQSILPEPKWISHIRHDIDRVKPAPFPVLSAGYGWEAVLPKPYQVPWPQAKIDDWTPLQVCPTVSNLPVQGSASQDTGISISLNFSTPATAFILLGITAELESGTPPVNIASVGGDASGLNWKKLAGGQFGATEFTLEYWGAFAPSRIISDAVTVTFSQADTESTVAFIALAGVNAMPVGRVIGPSTVANNLFVTFTGTSPRSMLFAFAASEPDDLEPVTAGLNTTVYAQPSASQFVRSTSPTLGGTLTMSTSGYTGLQTLYYLGIEILALPCYLHGLWGWESVLPPPFRAPLPQATNPDILPMVLRAGGSWEAIIPKQWQKPWPQAGLVENYPYEIEAFEGGFETIDPRPYRAPWLQATNPERLASSAANGNQLGSDHPETVAETVAAGRSC